MCMVDPVGEYSAPWVKVFDGEQLMRPSLRIQRRVSRAAVEGVRRHGAEPTFLEAALGEDILVSCTVDPAAEWAWWILSLPCSGWIWFGAHRWRVRVDGDQPEKRRDLVGDMVCIISDEGQGLMPAYGAAGIPAEVKTLGWTCLCARCGT